MKTHPSFQILQEIGRGPEATVYRARDLESKQTVAIKEVDPRWLQDAEQARQFWAEAQFQAALKHDNIVKVHRIDKERGWIVMESMHSGLNRRLAQGPLAPDLVRSILRQALQGLQFLHSQDRLHGAIKPSNVLIDDQGHVKLGDAAGLRPEGDISRPIRTRKYLAPELLNPEFGPVSTASDLFSLGFLALELLKGPDFDTLFKDVGPNAVDPELGWLRLHGSMAEKMPHVREIVPNAPDDLVRVIERLLEREVTRRYRSAAEALQDLDRHSAGPVRTPRATTNMPSGQSGGPWLPLSKPMHTSIPVSSTSFLPPGNPAPTHRPQDRRGLLQKLASPLILYPLCFLIVAGTAALLFLQRRSAAGLEKSAVRVVIRSRPDGAQVMLAGGVAIARPDARFELQPGSHPIRLELDRHKPLETTIEVKAGAKEQTFPFTLESAEPEFKVRVRSEPPGGSVFIDGACHPAQSDGCCRLKAGGHRVVVVHSEKGAQEMWIDVLADARTATQEFQCSMTPSRRALVIGVQDYGLALPAFRHGQGDAIDLYHTLLAVGYSKDNVVVMTQAKGQAKASLMPRADEIRTKLNNLVKACSTNDSVLLALAGLVIEGPTGGFAFCPAGAVPDKALTLIPLDEIFRLLRECKAGTKVVLLDVARRQPKVDTVAYPGAWFDAGRLEVPRGVVLACSCGPGEESYVQVFYRRGVFFDAVIRGLWGAADADGDRQVTVQELRSYVDGQTSAYVQQYYKSSQQPVWMGADDKLARSMVVAWPPRELDGLWQIEKARDDKDRRNEPFRKDDLKNEEKLLQEALLLTPPPLEALVKRAELHVRQVEHAAEMERPKLADQALMDCLEAEEREPTLAAIQSCRGDAWLAKEDYAHAVTAYSQAVKLDPHAADAYNSRATCYSEMTGQSEKALKDFDRAIELAINPTVALFTNRSEIHRRKKHYYLMLQDIERAMRLKDANAAVFQLVVKDCDEAIKEKKTDYRAYTIRGVAYIMLKNFDEAIHSFNEAIKINDKFVDAYEQRAEAHRKNGDPKKAALDEGKVRELKLAPKP